jgi:hypothetical protein
MAELWGATVEVTWHPILTFERKRLDLLDWIDDNILFTGFSRRSSDVGIRVGDDLRVTVRLSRVTIEARSKDSLRKSEALLEGVLQILKPRHPAVAVVESFWSSQDLEVDYEEARQRLAARASLGLPAPFIAVDTSVLMDVMSSSAEIQCEYGIVSDHELAARLTGSEISRIDGAGSPILAPLQDARWPSVALFGQVRWVPLSDEERLSAVGLLREAEEGIAEADRLVSCLVDEFGVCGG